MIKRFLFKYYLKVFSNSTNDFLDKQILISRKDLDEMFTELKNALEIFLPSRMWHTLSLQHIELLEKYGLDNFKRTINNNYFHVIPLYPTKEFRRLFMKWFKNLSFNVFPNFNSRLGTVVYNGFTFSLNGIIGIYYDLFVKMYYELTLRKDKKHLLTMLEEPGLGNPIKVKYKNRMVSHDICNSLLEYYVISEAIDFQSDKKMKIAELGAGYGRLAFVFLKIHPNHKYVIFDIPPALYISQFYLTTLFPELKIFKFRHFTDFIEIEKEFEECDLCFFTPNQLELFPRDIFGVFINISSLHEMRKDQITKYLKLIDRLTSGYFFTKQYPGMMHLSEELSGAYEVPFDEYPIPNNWKAVFIRESEIHLHFVEALYLISHPKSIN